MLSAAAEHNLQFLGKADQEKDPEWNPSENTVVKAFWSHFNMMFAKLGDVWESMINMVCEYYFCSAFVSDFLSGAREMLVGVSEENRL